MFVHGSAYRTALVSSPLFLFMIMARSNSIFDESYFAGKRLARAEEAFAALSSSVNRDATDPELWMYSKEPGEVAAYAELEDARREFDEAKKKLDDMFREGISSWADEEELLDEPRLAREEEEAARIDAKEELDYEAYERYEPIDEAFAEAFEDEVGIEDNLELERPDFDDIPAGAVLFNTPTSSFPHARVFKVYTRPQLRRILTLKRLSKQGIKSFPVGVWKGKRRPKKSAGAAHQPPKDGRAGGTPICYSSSSSAEPTHYCTHHCDLAGHAIRGVPSALGFKCCVCPCVLVAPLKLKGMLVGFHPDIAVSTSVAACRFSQSEFESHLTKIVSGSSSSSTSISTVATTTIVEGVDPLSDCGESDEFIGPVRYSGPVFSPPLVTPAVATDSSPLVSYRPPIDMSDHIRAHTLLREHFGELPVKPVRDPDNFDIVLDGYVFTKEHLERALCYFFKMPFVFSCIFNMVDCEILVRPYVYDDRVVNNQGVEICDAAAKYVSVHLSNSFRFVVWIMTILGNLPFILLVWALFYIYLLAFAHFGFLFVSTYPWVAFNWSLGVITHTLFPLGVFYSVARSHVDDTYVYCPALVTAILNDLPKTSVLSARDVAIVVARRQACLPIPAKWHVGVLKFTSELTAYLVENSDFQGLGCL